MKDDLCCYTCFKFQDCKIKNDYHIVAWNTYQRIDYYSLSKKCGSYVYDLEGEVDEWLCDIGLLDE